VICLTKTRWESTKKNQSCVGFGSKRRSRTPAEGPVGLGSRKNGLKKDLWRDCPHNVPGGKVVEGGESSQKRLEGHAKGITGNGRYQKIHGSTGGGISSRFCPYGRGRKKTLFGRLADLHRVTKSWRAKDDVDRGDASKRGRGQKEPLFQGKYQRSRRV